jgi:hypothetical protein
VHKLDDEEASLRSRLEKLSEEYSDIFAEEFGFLKDFQTEIYVQNDATPIYCRPRPIPFALKERVKKEIDRLVEAKIYTPVTSSEWATPIVPVLKADGSVRLTADYSVTVNRHIVEEDYPIPNNEDILSEMGECKYMSKYDVREAYMHVPVSVRSAKVLTVNTLKGLFAVNRLNYGLQSGPAKWQRIVEQMFNEIEGCRCFFDDIKISSKTADEHYARIKRFYEKCREYGVRLRKEKCQILTDELEYLGFKIDRAGVHKTDAKIKAIVNAKASENESEIRSFMGLITYYGRFVPNLSTVAAPLNNLLKDKVKFDWTAECQAAFENLKKIIASPLVLCHYDPRKKLILATDASPFGIGAVLSHDTPDGEKPIAFASRTLSQAEQNYSQVDRESLAIYWGVKKFFNYLYGRKFTLITDCKPLKAIFSPSASLPAISATRLLHYALYLQGFSYDIQYRKSTDHANADCMSRLPAETACEDFIDEPSVIQINQINTLPITRSELAAETCVDPETAPLLRALLGTANPEDVKFDIDLRKLTVEQACILYGIRVFVPTKFCERVLQELHFGHMGTTKMKMLARSYAYWPHIDADIEEVTKQCVPCAKNMKNVRSQIHPWHQAHGNEYTLTMPDHTWVTTS